MEFSTGEVQGQEAACGAIDCLDSEKCVVGLDTPNYGVTNFDNIGWALLTVFQSITLEGWSPIMILLQKSSSYWSFLYFICLIVLGAFFLMNLILVIIKVKFTTANDIKKINKKNVHSEDVSSEGEYVTFGTNS